MLTKLEFFGFYGAVGKRQAREQLPVAWMFPEAYRRPVSVHLRSWATCSCACQFPFGNTFGKESLRCKMTWWWGFILWGRGMEDWEGWLHACQHPVVLSTFVCDFVCKFQDSGKLLVGLVNFELADVIIQHVMDLLCNLSNSKHSSFFSDYDFSDRLALTLI